MSLELLYLLVLVLAIRAMYLTSVLAVTEKFELLF